MELHPILEARCPPNPGLWYCISGYGVQPSIRVGHSCTYMPGPDGDDGKVYVIGGANPDGSFAEVFVLDLATFSWDQLDCPGFKTRYEHSAFVPKSKPNSIFIFGGADMGGNHNDIQVWDTTTNTCRTVSITSGNPPSARTFRGAAVIDDKFYVYSGGLSNADPVGDRQVHCFDANTHAWTILNIKGDPPKPRQGHVMVAAGHKVILHGGMSGTTFYDDLHVLDTNRNTWTKFKSKKGAPSPRAAHSGYYHDGYVYIFGGYNARDGPCDDLYQLNLETMTWRRMMTDGPPPATRLSQTMCTVRLRVPDGKPEEREGGEATGAGDSTQQILAAGQMAKETVEEQLRLGSAGSVRSMGGSSSAGSQRSEPTIITPQLQDAVPVASLPRPVPQEIIGPSKVVDMLLIHGGMDTEGEIFDDCLVYMLKEEGAEAAASS